MFVKKKQTNEDLLASILSNFKNRKRILQDNWPFFLQLMKKKSSNGWEKKDSRRVVNITHKIIKYTSYR